VKIKRFAISAWMHSCAMKVTAWKKQGITSLTFLQLEKLVGGHLVKAGLLADNTCPFSKEAIALMQQNLELVQDSENELKKFVTYPLEETLASGAADKAKEDNLKAVVEHVLAQYDSGELDEVSFQLLHIFLAFLQLGTPVHSKIIRFRRSELPRCHGVCKRVQSWILDRSEVSGPCWKGRTRRAC
jgi:hypothetical protein